MLRAGHGASVPAPSPGTGAAPAAQPLLHALRDRGFVLLLASSFLGFGAHVSYDICFSLHLQKLGWLFERELTTILKFGQIREYIHFHVADAFPLELTAYEPRELRFRPRSSTDGKPIVRVRESALVALLAKEHPDEWARYQRVGEIEDLEALLAEDEDDEDAVADGEGSLAGLIDEGPAEEELWLPEPGEEEDPEQIYDPLPGFEEAG